MSRHESWHLFIAPLLLEKRNLKNSEDPKDFVENLKNSILKDSRFKFKERRFHIETPNDYNVFQYFFDDARRSIFWFDNENVQDKQGAIQFRLNVSDKPYKVDEPEPIGELLLRIYESNKNRDKPENGKERESKAEL